VSELLLSKNEFQEDLLFNFFFQKRFSFKNKQKLSNDGGRSSDSH